MARITRAGMRRRAARFMGRRRVPLRRRRRGLINNPKGLYYYKQTTNLGTIVSSVTAAGVPTPILAAYDFKLNALPQQSTLTSLYDQYKINKVVLTFRPRTGMVTTEPGNSFQFIQGYSPLMTVIDYDDATSPVNEAEMLEYQTLKMTQPSKVHKRVLRPKFASQVYASPISSGYKPSTGFIDCTNPAVPHYGVKVLMNAPVATAGTASAFSYDVYATYYVAFKNVR